MKLDIFNVVIWGLVSFVVIGLIVLTYDMFTTTDQEQCLKNIAKEYCIENGCEVVSGESIGEKSVFVINDKRSKEELYFTQAELERCKEWK